MRLLFAIKSLNVVGGGAERVLVDVANGMAARGHDVSVLTFDSHGESFYALDPRVKRFDTGVAQPGQPTPRTGFLRAIPKIRKAVIHLNPDLAIAFMHSTYVPLTAALLGSGVRLVASEHVAAIHYQSRPLQRALVWLANRLALAKTVPSLVMLDANKPGKTHVLPNTVNLCLFDGVAERRPQQPPVLLSVGRFMAEKNHAELVDAFAQLAPEFPDWTLRLVGEGELRSQLEAQVFRLGMEKRIALPGVSRNVAEEYARASVVVLPSLYESFGLVAAEALACGRPVVAFDCSTGVAAMVEAGVNGLLIPAQGDRTGNLRNGMALLMRSSEMRNALAKAGPVSVQRFALAGVLDIWERFLVNLAQAKRLHKSEHGKEEPRRSDD